MVYIGPKHLELEDHVVTINRVTKVVEGGCRLRFVVLVVVGDKNGHVGFGTGKTQEAPEVIRKTIEDVKKNLVEVPIVGSTTPHGVVGVFGGGRILMRPAVEGFGVAAGGPVRAVLELAGVADIISKSLGLNTPTSAVCATAGDLKRLKRVEEVAVLRGKSVEEVIG